MKTNLDLPGWVRRIHAPITTPSNATSASISKRGIERLPISVGGLAKCA
jgi:hypothetical protein